MSLIGGHQFEKSTVKPVVIGHRGFRGKFPENTLLALREGAKAGACILEADIQLASDNTVVMCHDVDTGRVYNKDYLVEETPYYGVLDQLHTKDTYRERMPTLHEVAEAFIHDPDFKDKVFMIDIKRSNGPAVIPFVRDVLLAVAPESVWRTKCILGVWRLDVLAAVEDDLKGFPVCFIGWEHSLARKFMEHEQVKAISISYASLAVYGGAQLMDTARRNHKDIYTWTVNSPEAMKWSVAARVKGVVGDYPDMLNKFFATITEKDLLSEFFTSEPNKFFSLSSMFSLYSLYFFVILYLLASEKTPWMVRKI